MRVLISGAGGLIGTALTTVFEKEGFTVIRLVRTKRGDDLTSVLWYPETGVIDSPSLEKLDVVVHLAGENIASRRWNNRQKARIKDSRVKGTRLLSHALAQLEKPPQTYICASATGYYGDRGDEILDETSSPGQGFLAEVCRLWEDACQPAVERGIRVVKLRTGVVLSRYGGALGKMLIPIKLGVGGRLGSGRQYISWIRLEDLTAAVLHIVTHANISGPVNLVSPQPVTNIELTQKAARLLNRPAFFPVPAFVLRLVAGEMADPLLLASARVHPARLLETGFKFQYPTLDEALPELLKK